MAFGDVYGYKTNSRSVPAFAIGDERTLGDDTVVDLVLVNFRGGPRLNVVVAASAEAAEVHQAFVAPGTPEGP
jgi:hypothetical protein